ncbi:apyrase-like [Anopheles ziemanni]|uniref:apyrase-like n=1 Tax=Anopheles coustani TaxID=139045 RepID=UPI0026582A1A|nr:apyrase-like [Anopheles coustani]XP_058169059.1 apyrase-like [Anopheles ziemanni]
MWTESARVLCGVLLTLCLTAPPGTEAASIDPQGVVISKPQKEQKDNNSLYPLTVIHLNDLHARYEEVNTVSTRCKPDEGDRCIGGYARVVARVRALQQEYADRNPIYLNAGDSFQGTIWYTLLRWNVTAYFLNLLPADAMTLGNHEFDHGVEGLVPFLEGITSPMVVANIDDAEEPTLQGKFQKSVILERGGRKIGIVGVIHHATDTLSMTDRVRFLDEVDAVNREAAALKQSGVDIIVVLSHCGITIDRKLARECPDVDVVVGGHSHTLLHEGPVTDWPDSPEDSYPVVVEQVSSGRKVLVVQAGSFSKYVGHLVMYFDDAGEIVSWEGNTEYLDEPYPKDDEIERELVPWRAQVDYLAVRPVGVSLVFLAKEGCRTGECNFGSFVADAFVDYYVGRDVAESEWTYAAIGITNDGGLRTSLNAGTLTYEDLVTAIPYENTVDTFDLRGEHLLEALEYSASRYGTADVLQFSGLQVVFNRTKPAFQRVQSVQVRCRVCRVPRYEPLQPSAVYRIAIAAWIGSGGNGYEMFGQHRSNVRVGPLDIDVFERYVQRMSPIMQGTDGRMKFVT